ncbi:MAG: rod shape-determining protein RodA [Spongiibacteraceae bacterium]|jgi:rod shape determining protein RodA|nr:rod shape-determining protein RodA [Spongiibacteraceae bacterium]
MKYGEFVRRMPGAGDLHRRRTLLQRIRLDGPLLALLLLLTATGLVVLYSASGQDLETVQRQGRFFLLAYGVMLVVAQIDLQRVARLAPWAYLGGVVLLLAVTFFGTHAKGAQRWLNLGGFQFQPSELMKIAMPMAMAWYLAARDLPPRARHIGVSLLIIAIPTLLIAEQPDLGTAILVASSGAFVLFLAGLSWRYIVAAIVVLLASVWPLWQFGLHDYQRRRVLTLLDPESDKLGAGWNIIQSKTAIGSGGYEGKGWLHGTQSHLDFLPEGHTDFIIAVLAEEWGLRGVLALLLVYTLLLMRGMWIAVRAASGFGRLLAGALVLTFFVYVFVNMGMVSGLLPVVGVPLPLISQGGTALVTLFAGFGLLMAIAAEKRTLMR